MTVRLISRLWNSKDRATRWQKKPTQCRVVLSLEGLEDRTVLSPATLTVPPVLGNANASLHAQASVNTQTNFNGLVQTASTALNKLTTDLSAAGTPVATIQIDLNNAIKAATKAVQGLPAGASQADRVVANVLGNLANSLKTVSQTVNTLPAAQQAPLLASVAANLTGPNSISTLLSTLNLNTISPAQLQNLAIAGVTASLQNVASSFNALGNTLKALPAADVASLIPSVRGILNSGLQTVDQSLNTLRSTAAGLSLADARAFLTNALNSIRTPLNNVVGGLQNVVTNLLPGLNNLGNDIGRLLRDVLRDVGRIVVDVGRLLEGLGNGPLLGNLQLGNLLQGLSVGGLLGDLENVLSNLTPGLNNLGNDIGRLLRDVLRDVGRILVDLGRVLEGPLAGGLLQLETQVLDTLFSDLTNLIPTL